MIDYEACVKRRDELREKFQQAKGKEKNPIAKELRQLDEMILDVEVFNGWPRK